MMPGRLSCWRKFAVVSSRGSVYVYVITPQNVMSVQVTLACVYPGCCTRARVSLRYEISQRYDVNAKRPLVLV